MRIIFRADGNSTIGLGHVVRSLALAELLEPVGAERWLAIQAPAAAVQQLAQQARVHLLDLPAANGTAEAVALATDFIQPSDVVVLDGYAFDTAYQQAIKSSGCRLVAIDDLCAWPQAADLIINHSPGIGPKMYTAPSHTRFCLGPEFSLVRAPFRQQFRLPLPVPVMEKVVVCFGGADPEQLTRRTVAALLTLPAIKQVSAVVGGAFAHKAELRLLARSHNAGQV